MPKSSTAICLIKLQETITTLLEHSSTSAVSAIALDFYFHCKDTSTSLPTLFNPGRVENATSGKMPHGKMPHGKMPQMEKCHTCKNILIVLF